MQRHRHFNAQHDEAVLRWEHGKDFERPYETIPLTTRTQATSFARRISSSEVMIVTPQAVRVLLWPLPAPEIRSSAIVRPRQRGRRTRSSRDPSCCCSQGPRPIGRMRALAAIKPAPTPLRAIYS